MKKICLAATAIDSKSSLKNIGAFLYLPYSSTCSMAPLVLSWSGFYNLSESHTTSFVKDMNYQKHCFYFVALSVKFY